MAKSPMWRRYLRFFGADAKADVDDELRFHLETKIDELISQGWKHPAATVEAQRQFGDIAKVRDDCHHLQRESEKRSMRVDLLAGWRHDVSYGLRQLFHRWPVTLLAVVTLGIGVGAVAAVFSIVNTVVLRPLPFADPDQIGTLWSTKQGRDDVVTPRNFDSWRRDSHSFKNLAALERSTFTLSEAGNAMQVSAGAVSSDFFTIFGVSPIFGRTFTQSEDTSPRQHVVVLGYRLWLEHFAGDRNVIGRQIRLNREPYTVIGVMPSQFDLRPEGEQLWIPLALSGNEMSWTGGVLYVFGRLQPHITLRQAQAEMEVISRVLQARYPEMNRDRSARVGELAADLVGSYKRQLLILLAAVGSVFLIACSNVANLLLARGTGRTRELSIRAALGASRARIARQLLIESFLLAFAGAGFGLVIATQAIHLAKVMAGAVVPRLAGAGLDATVLLTLFTLAFLCTLLAGVLPAVRAARVQPQEALVHGGRSAAGLARDGARNAYIAAEVGLALVLLIAAGLLIRSAVAAQNVQPGFVPDKVVTGRTALPPTAYKTADDVVNGYQRIQQEVAARPGVLAAALTSKVPLSLSGLGLVLQSSSTSPPLKEEFNSELQYVSPGYFATMQIPLHKGREFGTQDRAHSAQVAVVNETLAHRLWEGRDPIGQMLRLPEMNGAEATWMVVGVVADVQDDGLMTAPPATLYVPFTQVAIQPWQWTEQSLYLVARTQTESMASSELLRAALQQVDADLPLGDVLAMDQRLAHSVSAARFYTLMLTILGACGIVLTATGIYGVIAYFVSRQQAEIGIRLALGATRGNVLLFVVRQGMRPAIIGVTLGVIASLIGSRLLAAQLYGTSTTDPLTFIVVTCALLGVAAVACYIPARQAARVDPVIALRSE